VFWLFSFPLPMPALLKEAALIFFVFHADLQVPFFPPVYYLFGQKVIYLLIDQFTSYLIQRKPY
jgi:hypothetical protein